MYTISKQFSFSASHALHGLCADHPCSRVHGHNYVVTLKLRAEELDETGFVVDYRELAQFKQFIDHVFDHRHLNDVMQDVQPSAENIARTLYYWARDRWSQVLSVSVSETPLTTAEYRP